MASSSVFIETTQTPSVQFDTVQFDTAQFDSGRLVWTYAGDRWQHRIQVRTGEDWSDLLVPAVEGNLVLQDLFLEQRPDGEAEFQGMGQSATGIHSASILCDPKSATITFDLATRFRELSYVSPLWMEYHHPGVNGPGRVTIDPLEVSEAGTLAIESASTSLMTTRIEWTPPAIEKMTISRPGAGFTIQWGYRIRLNQGKS